MKVNSITTKNGVLHASPFLRDLLLNQIFNITHSIPNVQNIPKIRQVMFFKLNLRLNALAVQNCIFSKGTRESRGGPAPLIPRFGPSVKFGGPQCTI